MSVLDNVQLPYLKDYNAIMHGFKQGSYSIIVQPCNGYYTLQENIFDVHHASCGLSPREYLTVDNVSVANVSHSIYKHDTYVAS